MGDGERSAIGTLFEDSNANVGAVSDSGCATVVMIKAEVGSGRRQPYLVSGEGDIGQMGNRVAVMKFRVEEWMECLMIL